MTRLRLAATCFVQIACKKRANKKVCARSAAQRYDGRKYKICRGKRAPLNSLERVASLEVDAESWLNFQKIREIKEDVVTRAERIKMNETMDDVLKYLTETRPIGADGAYVSYGEISKKIGKSRHAVAYAVERLRLMGKIAIWDNKLHIVGA